MDPAATILKGIHRSLQLDRYSCVAQSVWMILNYFGRDLSIATIEQKLGTDKDGTSVAPIRRLLKSEGLITSINARATLNDVKRAIKSECPVLVSFSDDEHGAVVYGYSRGRIFMGRWTLMSPWRTLAT